MLLLHKDSPSAANIQGALHVDGFIGRRKRRIKKMVDTLYVCRPLMNCDDVIGWAKSHGFPTTLTKGDIHVTLAFSREPVDWSVLTPETDTINVLGGNRTLDQFGEATVLKFSSPQLEQRWQQFRDVGASWDHPSYQPHLTISWQAPPGLVETVPPYQGPIILGPEQFKPVKDDWKATIVEKAMDFDLSKTLGPKATAEDYIHDFVHSDNPRFKGKSKAERIKMALGAFYSKMAEIEADAYIEKIGARHSKSDREMVQTVHDHAVKLGADCMAKRLDIDEIKKAQIDPELGLVMGYAIICKVDGEPYYDLNIDPGGKRVAEHIPEEAMLKAAAEFMANAARPGNEMHDGPDKGTYVFAYPLTTDIAKALGVNARVTGLLVAYKPPPEVLAKFKDGTYKGFSIQGRRITVEEHDD